MLKKIGITLGILVLMILIYGTTAYLWMYLPTSGSRISDYKNPQAALLVIDLQEDTSGPSSTFFPADKTGPLIARVNQVIEAADDHQMPVIYIGQTLDDNAINRAISGGKMIEGQPGIRQDSRLKKVSSVCFLKKRSDAFSSPELNKYLVDHQINRIYLVGLDAVYCVYKTGQGGVNRGYAVTIIPDATITSTDKTRSDILTMYKKHGISTMSSSQFLSLKGTAGSRNQIIEPQGRKTMKVNLSMSESFTISR